MSCRFCRACAVLLAAFQVAAAYSQAGLLLYSGTNDPGFRNLMYVYPTAGKVERGLLLQDGGKIKLLVPLGIMDGFLYFGVFLLWLDLFRMIWL